MCKEAYLPHDQDVAKSNKYHLTCDHFHQIKDDLATNTHTSKDRKYFPSMAFCSLANAQLKSVLRTPTARQL